SALPQLESLLLDGAVQVTNRGIARLRDKVRIRELYLNNTQLNDDGVSDLAELSDLWSLALKGTCISDQGLQQLSSLNHLGILNICDTRVTGSGLAGLSSVSSSIDIYMDSCMVDDEGLTSGVGGLPAVGVLSICATPI